MLIGGIPNPTNPNQAPKPRRGTPHLLTTSRNHLKQNPI
jgi:hypothetical protein